MLCYVQDRFAYFTTQSLEDQWGDDWNDAPYYCNAGEPYEPGWYHYADGRSEKNDRDWNEDGGPKWEITKIAFDGPLYEPEQNVSVQDINKARMPWLVADNGAIHAGASVDEFISFVRENGGNVYIRP